MSNGDWLELHRPVSEYLNLWANRSDLLAFLGPDRGGETAFCDLVRGEIEANTDFMYKGYEKRDVIKHGVDKFRKFPVATGALYHEAMHARHTAQWYKVPAGRKLKTEREQHVLVMMEEPRIEFNGIKHDEKMQRYLRASSLRVAVGKKSKQRSAVDSMPLSLGRVPAGSLREKDVEHIRELFVEHLGETVVRKAEDIMTRFVHSEDGEHEEQVALVKEWCETVPEDVPEFTLDDLMKAMEAAAVYAGSGAMDDLDEDERAAKRRAKDRERHEKQDRKAKADRAGQVVRVPGMVGGSSYRSVPFSRRIPTSDERSAAVRLAKILSQVEYSDKVRSHVEARVPPGKLNMRRVINNRGARAAGARGTELPEWEMLRRTEVQSPTLRVATIVDVSGSMNSAMAPMASSNYVLSTAMERIHAKTATAYMGSAGYVQKHDKGHVVTFEACAGEHNFADATALLDSTLGMTLDESGARLAVIAGDGNYGPGEWKAALDWIRTLQRQGGETLWLGFGNSANAEAMCKREGVDFLRMTGREPPAEVATLIGNAAVEALKKAKKQ